MKRWSKQGSTALRLVAVITAVFVLMSMSTAAFARSPGKGPGWGHGRAHKPFHFDDLDEAPWAKGYMTLMYSKGIFQGRAPGRMAPMATVNRAEVITAAVRLRLLAEGKASLDESDGLPTPDQYALQAYDPGYAFGFADRGALTRGAAAWAAPYVQLAIELGFLDNGGQLRPLAAADRAWVAEILVRALEPFLETDPAAGGIRFTDTGQLPAGVVNYIEWAVRAGLFQGYPDGTFGPGKPLTRAELMTLMGRADERYRLTRGKDVYRGTLVDIRRSGGEVVGITVRLRGGAGERDDERDDEASVGEDVYERDVMTFAVDGETVVFIRGREASAAMLQVGDRVHVKPAADSAGQDGSLLADVIWATFETSEVRGTVEEAAENSITVTVLKVDAPDGDAAPADLAAGESREFAVADHAVLKVRGAHLAYDPGMLAAGDVVELKLHGDLVFEVMLDERPDAHDGDGEGDEDDDEDDEDGEDDEDDEDHEDED
ncbi:MAG TPA: S-layer homology domain-containing protein [Bacillota bacterium]